MVLLPGLDGTGKLFEPQVARLSQYFDLRCLAIPEDNRQDWDDLAEVVADLINREQPAHAPYLCGESYGGCLALKVALKVPNLLSRLILVNPASSLCQLPWLRWTAQAATYVPGWIYNYSGAFVFPLLANFDRIRTDWQQTFLEIVRPISRECVAWRLSMLQGFEVPIEQLRQLAVPTALIGSGQDRLLPSCREIRRLEQFLPNAITYCLPKSGHVCLLEDDIDLTQCLKALDFLPESSSIRV